MVKRQKASSRKRLSGIAAGEALPALDRLSDLPAWDDLAPSEAQLTAFRDAAGEDDGLALGCVVRLDRGYPAVLAGDDLMRAEFAARLSKADVRAAVGDWVVVRPAPEHDNAVIEGVLPRESDIARWRGGSRGERQTLAANVDLVLVVQQLSERELSCDRTARSAVIACDCGAEVAFVLTKADRAGADATSSAVALVREVLGEAARVAVVASGADGATGELADAAVAAGALWGADGVRALVPAGTVAIVLGESGAGKSTLLNELIGHEALETGEVRERDDAGRHTTVTRRMVKIPGAGVIVDEPGLRSLPLVGHERGLAKVFPEIADAAQRCRFRDCTHTHEPGCAVVEAHEVREFPDARLRAYLALSGEMRDSRSTLDPDVR